MHVGTGGGHSVNQGERSGQENHTLSLNEIPQHNHNVTATGDQGSDTNITVMTGEPNNVLASQARRGKPFYSAAIAGTLTPMHPGTISNTGRGEAHNNMQPCLTINFAIALTGVFPSRN